MRILRVLAFTLLLCALCVKADEQQVEEEVKEKVEEHVEEKEEDSSEENAEPEKTDEITEEKNVMVLHSVNFDRALSENKYLLVEFCKSSIWPNTLILRFLGYCKSRKTRAKMYLCGNICSKMKRKYSILIKKCTWWKAEKS